MSNLEDPLIQINWSKLKRYFVRGLRLVRKLGEEVLKIILKILILLVRLLIKIYLSLSKFAKSKQRGIWMLLLIFLLIFTLSFFKRNLKEGKEDYRELKQKHEKQLEEYQDLMEQKHELEKKLEESYVKPISTKVSVKRDVEHWRYLIEKYFPPEQVENALLIMYCESGGNPEAINRNDIKVTGYPSCGLFQINGPTNWEWDNPEVNVDRAVTKFYTGGWHHWFNCSKKLGLI